MWISMWKFQTLPIWLPFFNDARSASIDKINNVNYTLDCLLFGNQNLSIVENSEIFEHVSNYIILSKRFMQWWLVSNSIFDIFFIKLSENMNMIVTNKDEKVNHVYLC